MGHEARHRLIPARREGAPPHAGGGLGTEAAARARLVPCPALNATPEGAPVGLDLINGIPAHVSTS